MKKITIAAFLIFSLSRCTTVQEVQVPGNSRTEFPELAVRSLSRSSADDKAASPRAHDGKVHLFVSVGAPLPDRSRAIQELAFLRLRQAIQFADVTYTTLADPMKKDGDALDGRLVITFENGSEKDDFGIRLKLRPEDEGMLVKFHSESAPRPDQIEIAHLDTVQLLESRPTLRVTTDSLHTQEIHQMLQDCVMGSLEVQSTAGDTVVRVQGDGVDVPLGSPPIVGKKLVEGQYSLIATRKGQAPQELKLKILAGAQKRIFISWPDDPESATTAFLSGPGGLRISLDGEVRGRTPLYLLNEGGQLVEFSRPVEGGKYEIVGQTTLQGQDRNRVMLLKYIEGFAEGYLEAGIWQEVAEKTSAKGLSGLRSRPVVMDEQTAALSFPLTESDGFIAFITDQDSVFIERMGETFVVQPGHGAKMDGPKKAFKPIKKDLPERTIRFEYDKLKARLIVELDGTKIYEGSFHPSDTGKFYLLGPDANPVKKLQVKTGRGVYEE